MAILTHASRKPCAPQNALWQIEHVQLQRACAPPQQQQSASPKPFLFTIRSATVLFNFNPQIQQGSEATNKLPAWSPTPSVQPETIEVGSALDELSVPLVTPGARHFLVITQAKKQDAELPSCKVHLKFEWQRDDKSKRLLRLGTKIMREHSSEHREPIEEPCRRIQAMRRLTACWPYTSSSSEAVLLM